jgi:lipopolysaccharide export system protein LptC
MIHIPRKWRDLFSAWLPVLCMAFFALGTIWLVRSTPVGDQNADQPKAVGHEPDYFMRDFAVRQFDQDGRMTSELFGVEGLHHPDTDKLSIQTPRWQAYDLVGRRFVGRSDRALSNMDGSEIELMGNARVVREPLAQKSPNGKAEKPMTIAGEYLRAWTKDSRVSSDQPVELTHGDDVFTGDRFDYDNRTGVANLEGRVRGVIQPRLERANEN